MTDTYTDDTEVGVTDDGAPAVERRDAFHALGTQIPEGMSIREGLEFAHMADWDVRKERHRALVHDKAGRERVVESRGQFNVIRDNPFTGEPEVFGTVGERWTPFQNEDAASLLEGLADAADARLTTTLALDGGRKTGFVLELPEGMTFTSPVTGAKDVTNMNLVVFNSHNGGGSLSAVITPIRPFCANQQRAVEASARSRFSLRHTGEANVRMAQLREVVGESMSYRHIVAGQFEEMIARELADDQVLYELEKLFDARDAELTDRQRTIRTATAERVFDLYRTSETVAPFTGTAYGLYNAVTEYTDHKMRVVVPEGRSAEEMRALRTLNDGWVGDLKERAFAQLVPSLA